MLIDKYKKYRSLDFLKDENFIRWQLLKNEEDVVHWNEIIESWPDLRSSIEDAEKLFEANIRLNEFRMSDSESSECVTSLIKQIQSKKRKRFFKHVALNIAAAAAVIAIIIGFPFIFNRNTLQQQDISSFAKSLPEDKEIFYGDTKLILSENNTINLDKSESLIQYQEDEIKADNNVIQKDKASHFNQLITPYGKRSTIVFEDGTKAFLNAGSKLVYPAKFSKNKREIFLDGEIYIEVAEEKERPFIIKTSKMNVNVLGTRFNVSAYEIDKKSTVVLLSGSVRISSNNCKDNVVLKPNQMYTGLDDSHTIEIVEANRYILWTQGLYKFENEEFNNIVNRLERYYGISIDCDSSVSSLTCSGKLDLKDDMNKLLDELTQALPVIFIQKTDGSYYVKAN